MAPPVKPVPKRIVASAADMKEIRSTESMGIWAKSDRVPRGWPSTTTPTTGSGFPGVRAGRDLSHWGRSREIASRASSTDTMLNSSRVMSELWKLEEPAVPPVHASPSQETRTATSHFPSNPDGPRRPPTPVTTPDFVHAIKLSFLQRMGSKLPRNKRPRTVPGPSWQGERLAWLPNIGEGPT